MEEVRKKNLKLFKVITSQHCIQILPQQNNFSTQIHIDKVSSKVSFEEKRSFIEEISTKATINPGYETSETEDYCSLVLGVLQIQQSKFLIVAETVYRQPMLQPDNETVYQIAQIDYFPFAQKISKQQKKILQTLRDEIFNFGFYFSFERDMTQRAEIRHSNRARGPVKQYFWNEGMMAMLTQGNKQSIVQQWKIPIIQGFYDKFEAWVQQFKISYYIISRRSKYRCGTRFYSRGIDDKGNCSNTIETQQMIVTNNEIVSTVFISGSPPIFWRQKSQSNPVELTRNKQLTVDAFLEHIKSLKSSYSDIILLNLLEKKKIQQKLLICAYEQIFIDCQKQINAHCRYFYFDMNEQIRKGDYDDLINTIECKLQSVNSYFSCFMYDLHARSVKSIQKGIFRINCLDCLKRTNYFMQSLALKTIENQLKGLGVSVNFSLSEYLKTNIERSVNSFLKQFRNVWLRKADYESLILAGTRAASGRLDKFLDEINGSLVSIRRFYNAQFMDRIKQTAIDSLHRQYLCESQDNQRTIKRGTSKFHVTIMTWNVNAIEPHKLGIRELMTNFEGSDLIVFGIQQMIDLSPSNVVAEEDSVRKAKEWEKALIESLSSSRYIFVQRVEMVGLLLIIFIKDSWKNSLKDMHTDIVKTGYGGTFGNKGAVIIRVNINNTSLCFVCAHLAAGESKLKERLEDFQRIHEKAFQQNRQAVSNSQKIEDSDIKWFFGDLNFRADLDPKDSDTLGKLFELGKKRGDSAHSHEISKFVESYFERDTLNKMRIGPEAHKPISSYHEPTPQFLPTYKLENSTGNYTKQKNRVPSWCDRILVWVDNLEDLSCDYTEYAAIEVKGSDHRPVIGKFVVTIVKQESRRPTLMIQPSFRNSLFRDSYYHDSTD